MVLLALAGFPPPLIWARTFFNFEQENKKLSLLGALSWDKELDLVHVIDHLQLD